MVCLIMLPVKIKKIVFVCILYSSPLKQHMERQKKAFKSEWLNTPNCYKKEEIDEIGTPTPKKITRVNRSHEDSNCVFSDLH